MRLTPLQRLENEATERFGRGTAISVDRRPSWIVVMIWNAKGYEILNAIGKTRDASIRVAREAVTS